MDNIPKKKYESKIKVDWSLNGDESHKSQDQDFELIYN